MQLTTARCILTPWAPPHAESLGALLRDPVVRHYLLDDQLVTLAWVEQRIAESMQRFRAGGLGMWSVWKRDRLAGFAGFTTHRERQLELSYGLHPQFVGRGLATEAVVAVIGVHHATRHGPVLASIDEPNLPSLRLLQRLGFEEVGRTPATEFQPTQIHFALPRRQAGEWRSRDDDNETEP